MSEVHQFIRIFRLSINDRLLLLITFILTILVDLTIAIGIGVTTAALLFMRDMSKSVGIISNDSHTKEPTDNQVIPLPKHVEVLRVSGPLFFAVAGDIFDFFRTIGETPKVLVVDMLLVPFLDGTGARTLATLLEDCHKKGCKVILCSLQSQPTTILERASISEEDKTILFTKTYKDAVLLATELCKGSDHSLKESTGQFSPTHVIA